MNNDLDNKVPIPMKFCDRPIKTKVSDESLDNCSKEVLIAKVKKLDAHCLQLKNILNKVQQDKKPRKAYPDSQRPFDFTKYNTRHIAFRIMYLGWDLQGFTVQEETCETVEEELFLALRRTRLIESRETSNYHRCGRTDKGVSAFTQTISIDVRTNLAEGLGVIVNETAEPKPDATEIDYTFYMNKVLPKEIRVLGWCPVDVEFSARFNCTSRTYKYFFPKANLDLEKMQLACNRLLGSHDFRNFCKMDIVNGVVNFKRNVTYVSCQQIEFSKDDTGFEMCELVIKGKAFLWHQIRCIVALVILIGQSKESLELITSLLDIENNPCKPQYAMASELPLCLYDNEYPTEELQWIYDRVNMEATIKDLQGLWSTHAIRTTMLRSMLDDITSKNQNLDKIPATVDNHLKYQIGSLLADFKGKQHNPIMKRPKCESLENRVSHENKKRIKIDPNHIEIKINK